VAYFYPSKLEEIPSEPVLAGSTEELPAGASKTIRYGRYPALVIHTEEGLRAYSAVCTHFACLVKWNAELGQIVCPCHDGYFDALDGHVISGPPPSPLTVFKVTDVYGKIYVGGDE
jgi:nitrite reductase/ring-hydroxylating ferredoxin subunit